MKFFINGVPASPVNYEAINLVQDKVGFDDAVTINPDTLVFVNEDKEQIETHLATKGYFKGIPFTIMLNNGFTLDYYLDPTVIKLEDNRIEIKAVKRYELQTFWNQVDATTFDLLVGDYGVTFTTVDIPFIVKGTNVALEIAIYSFFVYSLSNAIIETVAEISRVTGDVLNGVGLDPSDIAYAIAMGILLIIKLTLLIITLINVLKKLVELVYPPLRYYKGASIKTLIQEGCAYFGYTVSGSLLDKMAKIHYQGVPINKRHPSLFDTLFPAFQNKLTNGYPTATDRTITLDVDFTTVGGLIRYVLSRFNGRIIVRGNKVKLLARNEFDGITPSISTALTNQEMRVTVKAPNTNEAWSRCIVQYPVDPMDIYTFDTFDDQLVEFATLNKDTSNVDLDLIKGVKNVDMGFAQAKRRTDFNIAEKFLSDSVGKKIKDFFQVLQGSNSLLNKILNPDKRVGVCVYSQDYYSIPKLIYLENGKIPSTYKDFIGATAIFNNYHRIDFIGTNDFMIKEAEMAECTNENFVNLRENDFAEINGVVCEVLNVEYNEYANIVKVTYKEPSDYAKTVKLEQIPIE